MRLAWSRECVAAGVILAIVVLLGGCASGNGEAAGPSGSGTERFGLTVESWVIRDQDYAIAKAFADLETQPGWLDGESAALWRSNGIRVFSVPIEQLGLLRGSLPAGGPSENRELGESTTWTPVATGPDLADRTLRLDSGLLSVGAGQVRLLARSWIEPVILVNRIPPDQAQGAQPTEDPQGRVASRVRIELAPQFAERLPARSPLQIEAERRPSAVDRGLVFDRLVLSMLIGNGEAIVLVGESPDADWSEFAEQVESGAEEGEGDSEEGESEELDDRVEFPIAGPRLHPTLGEALLNASSYAAGSSPLRVVVVLVASPPGDFALLNR